MGEMGYAFHQNNITIKASMSFRPSEDIGEKLQELKVLVHEAHLLKKKTITKNNNSKEQQHKNSPVRLYCYVLKLRKY